jgi:Flp pilus assembly protein TadG
MDIADVSMAGASAAGAMMLQLAVVLPIFLLLVLGVMDLARYMTIQALLTRASQAALGVATKITDFDKRYDKLTPSDPEYQAFVKARNAAMAVAENTALNTMLSDCNTPSSARLLCANALDVFQSIDPLSGSPYSVSHTSDVAVLRPGEAVKFVDSHSSESVVDHPTVKPGASVLSPRKLMESEPIVVEMRAEVDMFLPLFGPMTVTARAAGYRERIPDVGIGNPAAPNGGGQGSGGPGTTGTPNYPKEPDEQSFVCDLKASWEKCIGKSKEPGSTGPQCVVNVLDAIDGLCKCILCPRGGV